MSSSPPQMASLVLNSASAPASVSVAPPAVAHAPPRGDVATAVVTVRIYYEDTDAGGLVHHSNYLRYFERGREHLLGCDKLTELFATSKRSFVVAGMSVLYKKGARWGDVLQVRTSTVVHSPYRVEFRQDVYRGDELIVEGHVFMATVEGEGAAMKLTQFPDYILNGEVPTIPGLAMHQASDGSGRGPGTAQQGRVARKRLPPPRRRNKGGADGAAVNGAADGWRLFGSAAASQTVLTVYLDDTDFTGICYNSNYLKWMERARANAIGIHNLANMRSGGEGVGAAIYKAELSFKKGAKFGDSVVVTTRVKLESEYRVAFKHEIREVPEELIGTDHGVFSAAALAAMPLLVTAEITLVFLSGGGAGALVKLPEAVVAQVSA